MTTNLTLSVNGFGKAVAVNSVTRVGSVLIGIAPGRSRLPGVRFVVDAPAAGQLSLEVYNSLGQRVATVYRGHILAGKGQVFEQNLSSVGDNMLYYVLRLNGQQVTGKLLQIKR